MEENDDTDDDDDDVVGREYFLRGMLFVATSAALGYDGREDDAALKGCPWWGGLWSKDDENDFLGIEACSRDFLGIAACCSDCEGGLLILLLLLGGAVKDDFRGIVAVKEGPPLEVKFVVGFFLGIVIIIGAGGWDDEELDVVVDDDFLGILQEPKSVLGLLGSIVGKEFGSAI